jgi:glycosyltransferase involved in cell wall biosynthesis
VLIARHAINLGQGAALETARRWALSSRHAHGVFVTMDADGQHDPAELPRFLRAIDGGADVVFGNRFAEGASNVPRVRAWLLRVACMFEYAVTGLRLGDAHNGYRAFRREAIARLRIRQNRMAHATEIRLFVAREKSRLRVAEVGVTIRYSEDILAKGQSSLGALSILRDFAFRLLFGVL